MKKKNQLYVTVIILSIAINIIACSKEIEMPVTSQHAQTQASEFAKTNTKTPPGYTGGTTIGDSTRAVK